MRQIAFDLFWYEDISGEGITGVSKLIIFDIILGIVHLLLLFSIKIKVGTIIVVKKYVS